MAWWKFWTFFQKKTVNATPAANSARSITIEGATIPVTPDTAQQLEPLLDEAVRCTQDLADAERALEALNARAEATAAEAEAKRLLPAAQQTESVHAFAKLIAEWQSQEKAIATATSRSYDLLSILGKLIDTQPNGEQKTTANSIRARLTVQLNNTMKKYNALHDNIERAEKAVNGD